LEEFAGVPILLDIASGQSAVHPALA